MDRGSSRCPGDVFARGLSFASSRNFFEQTDFLGFLNFSNNFEYFDISKIWAGNGLGWADWM